MLTYKIQVDIREKLRNRCKRWIKRIYFVVLAEFLVIGFLKWTFYIFKEIIPDKYEIWFFPYVTRIIDPFFHARMYWFFYCHKNAITSFDSPDQKMQTNKKKMYASDVSLFL